MAKNFFTHLGLIVLEKTQSQNGGGGGGGGGREGYGYSNFSLRASCSHEPETVNYPGVMIAPGQVLPRVRMMICCPGASSRSSDHYELI